ncbi:hypothetical protein JCM33374_g6424 [Metschnikowia sp. JCM 33374]|nr:hypothetical protein JCM33374_g6424 [Metschnikowia sp. JCM 33374]
MWPFTSADKSSSELDKELPENLKEFFKESDPSYRLIDHEEDPKESQVQKVLARQSKEYDGELDRYKHSETPRKVATINCAELQQAVVACYQGWSFFGNECSEEIIRTTKCLEIQQAALKKLRFGDCYSVKHCSSIRAFTDLLFTSHFGQFGENINEETTSKFDTAVDEAFAAVWR